MVQPVMKEKSTRHCLLMRTIRTVATRARFLASLRETPNVSLACVNAGISRNAAYDWRRVDEKFATAWEEALSVAIGYLEEEARRRAVEGVYRVRYHKDGQVLEEWREYSDTLLLRMLAAEAAERLVAAIFDVQPVVSLDQRTDQRAVSLPRLQPPRLVLRHQGRVAHDVGEHDCGQPSARALRLHAGPSRPIGASRRSCAALQYTPVHAVEWRLGTPSSGIGHGLRRAGS